MKLFAVLDIDHPMVAWEVAIGRILATPVKDINGVEYPTPSLWLYNNIYSSVNDKYMSDLSSEFHIEKVRISKFPDKPSRLTGAFFFESKDDAINACRMWEWENKIDYISEIDFQESSYIKLDSNWITLRIRCCEKSEIEDFIVRYYSGEVLFTEKPLNEIICTGHGTVLNSELRRMAYKKIRETKPDSSLLLALGISCYEQNPKKYKEIFRVSPFIKRNENDDIEGIFITSLTHLDEDEEGIAKLAKRYIHNNGTSLTVPNLNKPWQPLKIIRPLDKNKIFSLGNLSSNFFIMGKDDYIRMIE